MNSAYESTEVNESQKDCLRGNGGEQLSVNVYQFRQITSYGLIQECTLTLNIETMNSSYKITLSII